MDWVSMNDDKYEMHMLGLKQFKSGAKRDNAQGKGAYELISPLFMKRMAMVYEKGATQKGNRNWENGFPMSRCIQSALRHLYQRLEGREDEDHTCHAVFNLIALVHFEEQIKRGNLPPELNDLPNYMKKEENQGSIEDIKKADKEIRKLVKQSEKIKIDLYKDK